jgi:hypothetical protein
MKGQILVRLKVDRLHVAPRALELSPANTQRRFKHIWAPLDELLSQLRPLPAGLVRFWLDQPGGHIMITHLPSHYEPGEQAFKHGLLRNIAFLRLSELAEGSLEALVPLGHLLDHLLGNGGALEGLWLSEGGGIDPVLREVGGRVHKLFPLGYGFDEAACGDARTYFARSLALYLHDRRELNVADPQIERLLRTTVLSAAFWRSRKMRAASWPVVL